MNDPERRDAGTAPSWTTTRSFARAGPSVAAVRAWSRERLSESHQPADVVDLAELLISELATNALRHGGGDRITVRLHGDGEVVAAVHDLAAARLPHLRHPGPDDPAGRGLGLVQALATSWGTRTTGAGKWVWFRLRGPSTGAPGPARPGRGVLGA